jgi:hypothetical protein
MVLRQVRDYSDAKGSHRREEGLAATVRGS